MRAFLERLISPSLGTCARCRRPWKFPKMRRIARRTYQQLPRNRFYGLVGVEAHSTPYAPGSSCFPLCEGCWATLTPEQRLPYYDHLFSRWAASGYPPERSALELMRANVLAGK